MPCFETSLVTFPLEILDYGFARLDFLNSCADRSRSCLLGLALMATTLALAGGGTEDIKSFKLDLGD